MATMPAQRNQQHPQQQQQQLHWVRPASGQPAARSGRVSHSACTNANCVICGPRAYLVVGNALQM
jgi:hypothetical protein